MWDEGWSDDYSESLRTLSDGASSRQEAIDLCGTDLFYYESDEDYDCNYRCNSSGRRSTFHTATASVRREKYLSQQDMSFACDEYNESIYRDIRECKEHGIRYYIFDKAIFTSCIVKFVKCMYDCYEDVELCDFDFLTEHTKKAEGGLALFGIPFFKDAITDIDSAYEMYKEEYKSICVYEDQCLDCFKSRVMYSKETFKIFLSSFNKLYASGRLYRVKDNDLLEKAGDYLMKYKEEHMTPAKNDMWKLWLAILVILIIFVVLLIMFPMAALIVMGLVFIFALGLF